MEWPTHLDAHTDCHTVMTTTTGDDYVAQGGIQLILGYTRTDPYAVYLRIGLPDDPDDPVVWVVSRETLTQAAAGKHAGLHDFQAEPDLENGVTLLIIRDPSQTEGHIPVTTAWLRRFLSHTNQIVRFSREHEHLNLDDELAQLLAEEGLA